MSLSDLNQTPTHIRLILKSRVRFWTKLYSSCSVDLFINELYA